MISHEYAILNKLKKKLLLCRYYFALAVSGDSTFTLYDLLHFLVFLSVVYVFCHCLTFMYQNRYCNQERIQLMYLGKAEL